MLDKEEEKRLDYYIEELGTEGILGIGDVKWLASKLHDINKEAFGYYTQWEELNGRFNVEDEV